MKPLIKDFKDIFIYTFTSITTLVVFIVLLVFIEMDITLSLLLSLILGAFLFYQQDKNKAYSKKDKKVRLKKLSAEKEDFYSAKGLTKEETQYFRETMNTAKANILELEKNFNSSSKLKAIEHRNNTISLTKGLFKAITNEPNRLHEVDKFLYVHLPSLAELTKKYLEINDHLAKSKSSFQILEESANTIDDMCELVAEDYVKFKSGEIEDLELEVELAKQTLNSQDKLTEAESFKSSEI
ncbi:5-bromo-4-chloroindolyl phosphate hydrolysis family protein [Lacticigenium naphthae]|uniref:5-bromo-4-chloroindolyl phosphate hydrolysis family protein n=1 Tax=Lacticigenium naphthae TaxID=515351 RepID=UPI000424F026|nr:5-bromo-4-chloroindolyl phosphate hydrolysis family protein [Lacticigenium naphthae]